MTATAVGVLPTRMGLPPIRVKTRTQATCYVCYMHRISHRDLRNNSSEILRAVDNGESFEITNYGRVVALIVPAPTDPLETLRASGRIQPSTTSVAEVLAIEPVAIGRASGDILDDQRSDR